MRTLPVRVDAFPAETVPSVYWRLVDRNALTTGELWTAIRRERPHLPLQTAPEMVPDVVEQLAGLAHGHFVRAAVAHLLPIRCRHNTWQHTACVECSRLPAASTMCRRCANGETVQVRGRSGAVCLRHKRWHHGGTDEPIDRREYLRAERCLTGTLWKRGIGLQTGELDLASELLTLHDDPGLATDKTPATGLRATYPKAIRLVTLLTQPWATRFLRDKKIGHLPIITLIEAAMAAITSGSRSDLQNLDAAFQIRGRDVRLPVTNHAGIRHGRRIQTGALGAIIRHQVPRIRGVLLRHTDARTVLQRTKRTPS